MIIITMLMLEGAYELVKNLIIPFIHMNPAGYVGLFLITLLSILGGNLVKMRFRRPKRSEGSSDTQSKQEDVLNDYLFEHVDEAFGLLGEVKESLASIKLKKDIEEMLAQATQLRVYQEELTVEDKHELYNQLFKPTFRLLRSYQQLVPAEQQEEEENIHLLLVTIHQRLVLLKEKVKSETKADFRMQMRVLQETCK